MCCYLNRTDGYDDDVCTRGACLSRYWPGEYFVIACTSSDWEESGCSPLWKACGESAGVVAKKKPFYVNEGGRNSSATFDAFVFLTRALG